MQKTNGSAATIRVMVISPSPLVCAGLRSVFRTAGDITVVAEISGPLTAQPDICTRDTDVVLLDTLALHEPAGPTIRRTLLHVHPPVLVFTMSDSMPGMAPLLRDYASGYVSGESGPEVLAGAIRCVAAGGQFTDPALAAGRTALWAGGLTALSSRELEVLRYLARGYTVARTASALGLASATIYRHRTRIMQKLQLRGSAELVVFAMTDDIPHPSFNSQSL
ncbi:putative Bacterial regulatory s, luxR family protein [Paraburkholderia kururiensis]|uniref:response regulator transcription factor n=1 Tax=Paraburkholderia kururiensis TaxID=984307 RepID=UPI0039A6CE4B